MEKIIDSRISLRTALTSLNTNSHKKDFDKEIDEILKIIRNINAQIKKPPRI